MIIVRLIMITVDIVSSVVLLIRLISNIRTNSVISAVVDLSMIIALKVVVGLVLFIGKPTREELIDNNKEVSTNDKETLKNLKILMLLLVISTITAGVLLVLYANKALVMVVSFLLLFLFMVLYQKIDSLQNVIKKYSEGVDRIEPESNRGDEKQGGESDNISGEGDSLSK